MIQETIDRLIAECPSLASVSSAEELDAIDKGTAPRNGATFVVPFMETGEENTLSNGVMQHLEIRLLVVLLVRRHDDAKGGKRASSYDQFKAEIEDALLGWLPADASDPFEFVSARSAPRGNGVSIHVQTWKTGRYLRKI